MAVGGKYEICRKYIIGGHANVCDLAGNGGTVQSGSRYYNGCTGSVLPRKRCTMNIIKRLLFPEATPEKQVELKKQAAKLRREGKWRNASEIKKIEKQLRTRY